jgi:hypothetical protein
MVNELLIHGNDIARAVKAPWAMPPEDAALFFDLFYVGLLSGNTGRLLEGSKRPLKRRIAVGFRSGYTIPVTFVVRNGEASVEPSGPGVDATVRFDPATLNMMMFGLMRRDARAAMFHKYLPPLRGPGPAQARNSRIRPPMRTAPSVPASHSSAQSRRGRWVSVRRVAASAALAPSCMATRTPDNRSSQVTL